MTERILDNLGPYLKHPPVAAFCDLSKRVFELFHETRGSPEDRNETPRQHLLTRLVYIGESTSTAIRMAASAKKIQMFGVRRILRRASTLVNRC